MASYGKRRRPILTPGRVTILLVLGLVTLQALVALSAPYWARLLRRPVRAPVENGEVEATAPPPTPQATAEVERRINVKLFFEAPDRPGLQLEERSVVYDAHLARQLKIVLEELISGSRGQLISPIPPETKALEVFVTADGCAYVDLSREILLPRGAGSQEEEHTVYSIVNTLTSNFPAVTHVQLLVEDRPVLSLGGHTDLSRPLLPDMTLLAPSPLTPTDATDVAAAERAAPAP
jgi:hypothetical protein